jgi:hypothetical protein
MGTRGGIFLIVAYEWAQGLRPYLILIMNFCKNAIANFYFVMT